MPIIITSSDPGPLTLIPDGEQIVGDYLREHPSVSALGARVAGRTPSAMSNPWVRVTKLDAPKTASSTPERLIHFLFQLDCYAGDEAMRAHSGHAEASLLGRTVRAALVAMPDLTFDDVVVTDAQIVGDARIPDPDTGEGARERIVLTATVRMHAR
jgi:hypothetical protein